MNRRVGILGLIFAAAIGIFAPAVASAQDGYDCYRGYAVEQYRAPVYRDPYHYGGYQDYRYHDRREAREWRERQEWRDHQWREREHFDRRDPYYRGYR